MLRNNCASIAWLLGIVAVSANATTLEVTLTGVEAKLHETLFESLSLVRHRDTERLTPAFIKTLYGRAESELQSTLRAEGYYSATISAALDEQADNWHARFDVQPGPPVIVKSVSVTLSGSGSERKRLRKAAETFPLHEGRRFRHADYEIGKRALRNAALELGYLESEWTESSARVDPAQAAAFIDLTFESGPRYSFGEIELPETVVRREILEQMMPFASGDPYDAELLLAFQQRLRDANYFRDVEVAPDMNAATDETIPVRVRLTPASKNSWGVGGGFGTDTGPRVGAGWQNRYYNDRGHRVEARLRLAPVTSSLSGTYLMPFFGGEPVEVGLNALVARENTDTSESNSFQGSVKRLRARGNWNETLSLSYRFEDFDVAGDSGTSHLMIPGIGYWRSRGDDPVYTRNGYRLSADLRGAVEAVISDVTFLQLRIRGKYIRQVGEDGRFITRADLGGTLVDSVDQLPATVRFFAGGDNSVRGFDYESLGPKNDDGEVVGGRLLAVGSIEYEHRIHGNWSAAVFSDAGNAFDKLSNDIAYSVGAGVRWRSPVGLVRLDIAAGISDPDTPIRVHFTVGPDL